MEVLLIKNEHDLIFKTKSPKTPDLIVKKSTKNFVHNLVKKEIGSNKGIYNFIDYHFDLSSSSNYLTSTSSSYNLETLNPNKFSSIINFKNIILF